MRHVTRIFAFALALASGHAVAADVGRVVLAAGDTSALRQGQAVKLVLGAPVQDSDVLRTGPASNLQVRFEDDSYIALREASELRVDQFKFGGGAGGGESAVYSLLKGGLRAVTGLIGRQNHDDYKMNTPTATIGIRGTDYAATYCQGDCKNPDGSPARDGVYGRVIGQSQGTNQIHISNDADQRTLGINSNFFVGDRKAGVELLLVAPEFVLSKLEGRSRGGSKGAAGGTGSEQASSGGAADESRPSTIPAPLPPLQFVATQDLGPQGGPRVLGESSFPATGVGGIAFYLAGTTFSTGFPVFADFTSNASGQMTGFLEAGFLQGLIGSASVLDSGSAPGVGNLHWGHWLGPGGSVMDTSGTSGNLLASNSNLVYAVGAAPTLPNSGQVVYSPIGGTRPVNSAGVTGNFIGATVNVDFLARQMNTANLQFGFNGAVYTLSGTTTFASGGTFFGGLSGTCSGTSCGASTVSGADAGSFVGANAAGIAMVYHALDPGVNGDIIGAQGFQQSGALVTPPGITAQIAFANLSPSVPGSTWTLASNEGVYSGNNLVAFTTSSPLYGNVAGGSIVETGSTPLVDGGTMSWGRWTGATQVNDPVQGLVSPSTGLFFVAGQNANLPTSGTFLYSFAGAPNPTNVNGVSGSFTGGAFNVSFGSTSGSLSVASPLTLSVGGVGYTLGSCTSGCSFTNSSAVAGNMVLSGSCSGGACSTGMSATGNAAGVFVGPQGAGLAVAGNIFSPAPTVSFGAAFKR